MKQYLFVAAAALSLAASAAHAQSVTPNAADPHRYGGHGKMMQKLGLSSDQQARVNSIHSKYEPQLASARSRAKPDVDAFKSARSRGDSAGMRAARERMKSDMAPARSIRKNESNEVRGVLTPSQRQQLDSMRAQHKAKHKGHGKRSKAPLA